MKTHTIFCFIAVIFLSAISCTPDPATGYQEYMADTSDRAVLVLNSHSESISALVPASTEIYNDVQLVGHSGTNKAIPSDIIVYGNNIHVILSGQNSIETYDKNTLDYKEDGKHYFKNGFNPMTFIPVPGKSWIFAAGFGTDDVQPVNLTVPGTDYSFKQCYEAVEMPAEAHSETKTAAGSKNATGDNKKRGSTGGAVYEAGASSRLYLTNVRYDSSILLTAESGDLAEYPEGSGRNVKAGGYFREATISIFGFNADAMTDGASDSSLEFSLIKEINLEALFSSAAAADSYFPGDGLNPQSVFILDGRLNVICTGTNGGNTRYYTSGEYLPAGYAVGDEKPGTNPDDGLVIVFDLSDPDNPAYLTHIDIGGSPVGYRTSIDAVRKIVYLAGVGGIQSYSYGAASGDYIVRHPSTNMLLTSETPESDFYSGLCCDTTDEVLYISFYSGDSIKTVNVSGTAQAPLYSEGSSFFTGDGPGALCILEK